MCRRRHLSRQQALCFFWTDHCAHPSALTPDPVNAAQPSAAAGTCLEIPEIQQLGRSVLAWARRNSHRIPADDVRTADGQDARMPSGFVYVTAAQTPPRSKRSR